MLKKPLAKVGVVGLANGLNAVISFAFFAMVAKSLDLNTFGIYALLTTLLVSVSRIIDFGTNSVFVVEAISGDIKSLKNSFLTLRVLLSLATFPIYIVTLALFHKLTLPFLTILFIGSLAHTFYYTLFAVFQKDENYLSLVVMNLLPPLVKGTAGALIFFSVFTPTLTSAILIFSFSMLTSLFLIPALPKNFLKFNFTWYGVKDLIKKSYPAGVSQLVAEWWPTITNSIAKATGGFSNVGIFSLANKISHIFALVSFSIFTVLLPKNAERKKQKLKYDFYETLFISFIIIAGTTLSIPVAHYFITHFFGAKFSESLSILNILIISSGLTSIHTFTENFFYIEEKTNYILAVNLGKLVVLFILALILVPAMSLTGLAYSDLTASVFAVILTIILMRKSVRI